MMPRKKRIALAIAIPSIIVIIIIITGILLYLNTDMFKSNKTLFFKYFGKNSENIKEIEEIFESTEYEKNLQNNKYTDDINIKVNYTNNLQTTSEDNSNTINNVKLLIKGEEDKNNKYSYKDFKLEKDKNIATNTENQSSSENSNESNNKEQNIMEVEYIKNDNNYGIRFSDLFKQYLLVENNNLKDLFRKIGYSEQELENVPDSIEINDITLSDIKFTEDEIKQLSEKYSEIINKKVSKEKFEKNSKQVITINEKNITTNAYILKLTNEELNNLYVDLLESLKQDEIILNKIESIQNKINSININSSESKDLKESFAEEKICADLEERFKKVDKIAEYNQLKVIGAMQKNKVAEAHFNTTTGYGYNDLGRETLEKVYADVFHTEDALVRPQITCGTHALALALSANLRPNDKLVYISGKPYDTLEEVIGIRPSNGSLAEYGVKYDQVDLLENGEFDFEGIKEKITNDVKVVGIQRSKGYATRPTLSVEKISQAIKAVKEINPNIIVMVDNCYGEFVEEIEPSDVGADMIVGSLIKNPGGGLAPIGGYICGTKQCIENCSYRLTTPGLGKEVGANLGVMSSFYQGLFLAPNVVASALKGAIFAANLFEKFNFNVIPDGKESRHDIIQAIEFGNPDCVIAFCKGIQAAAPVDSYLTPEPWDMPGYDAPVIMAAGAFVSGSSIELSADGPIKPPYAVYFQGGLTWHHAKLGILKAFQNMVDDGLITLK